MKRRSDRWEQVCAQFDKHNIQVLRFGAIDGQLVKHKFPETSLPAGPIGCLLSHLSVLKHAREKQYNNICIFEDDVEFNTGFLGDFNQCYNQLPDTRDIFYLGGGYFNNEKNISVNSYSNKLDLCKNILTTTAYCVDKTAIHKLIDVVESSNMLHPIDVIYVEKIQSDNRSYICSKRIITQAAGYSDIVNDYRHYKNMRDGH